LETSGEKTKPISLSEVKNILKKINKERKELLYEQKIALEHAQKFAKLPIKKTEELIKELLKLEFLEEIHVYKIADILPLSEDDVKTIFAKERMTLGENEIKKILEIVGKYYVQ
jgi:DNA-directed RNA polymerase subunit F